MAGVNAPDLKRIGPALYGAAGLMVLVPLFDLATNVWPARLGDPGWRYGALGLLASFMLTPLLGTGIAAGVAALLGHGRMIRAVGWLNAVGGGLLLVASGLFLLDAVQIRSGVGPDAIRSFDIGVVKAVVKFLVLGAGFLWLGVAGLRRGRHSAREPIPLAR